MNKNLIKPKTLTQIFKQFDKDKKEKPESIGGKPVVLVFLYEEKNEETKKLLITKVKMCSEKQVDQIVMNSKKLVEFTHYSVRVCKDKAHQEKLFMSILNSHNILSIIQTKNMEIWKGLIWTKKHFKITKWELNKMQSKNEHISLNYNGVLYWHIPSIEQMIEIKK